MGFLNNDVAFRKSDEEVQREQRLQNLTYDVKSSSILQSQKDELLQNFDGDESEFNRRMARFKQINQGTMVQQENNNIAMKMKNETPGRSAAILTRGPGILG